MVDTARHFEPVASLKAIVDSLAYAKLNVLHWLVTLYNHTSSCHHTAPHRTIPYHTHYITCSAMLNAELVHMIMVLCYAMLWCGVVCRHMSDSQSFPFESKSHAKLWDGAFSPEERYSQLDARELVRNHTITMIPTRGRP